MTVSYMTDSLFTVTGDDVWPNSLYSPEFDASEASALVLIVKHANIYARAAPREKQLIVQTLQAVGHVVAMVSKHLQTHLILHVYSFV
jgi:hypothetical protein